MRTRTVSNYESLSVLLKLPSLPSAVLLKLPSQTCSIIGREWLVGRLSNKHKET